jgi:hypothetical protein
MSCSCRRAICDDGFEPRRLAGALVRSAGGVGNEINIPKSSTLPWENGGPQDTDGEEGPT